MDKEQLLSHAHQAASLSQEAVALIKNGEYKEGHSLMRQAVEAGRSAEQLLKGDKVELGLSRLQETQQS